MKKSLFLLPLLASFALAGCEFTIGGKTITLGGNKTQQGGNNTQQGGNNTDNGGNGGGNTGGSQVVLDFTDTSWKDDKVTPYIDSKTDMGVIKSFEYEGITYNDVGCYASAGYSGAPNYLMMKNTKYGENADQYATVCAFVGNKTAFSSPIKKVTVVVEGTNSSGNTIYRVNIGTSEITAAPTTGGATGGKGQTFSTTSTDSKAYYFSVSTNKTSDGKVYNGQIVSITIDF